MSGLIGTTNRVLSLLRLLAEAGRPLGVKEVSDALGLPMSTSHRLLDMLVEADFVEKDEARRRYGVGFEFCRIGNLVARNRTVAETVQPVLDALSEHTGETALLGLYLPGQRAMTYAAKRDSPDQLRFRIDLFKQMPLEWGAMGLAILAFLPDDVQADVFRRRMPSPVDGHTLDEAAYRSRLDEVRRQGFAVSEGEKLADAVGVAVPLSGVDNAVGSLALTIPKFRFERDRTDFYADLLKSAAARLAGGTDAAPARRG